MGNSRKKQIERFWKAKTALTAAILITSFTALLFIVLDGLNSWTPWLFVASAVALMFFDLRKGCCPFCHRLLQTANLTKEKRFRFCPYCAESLVAE